LPRSNVTHISGSGRIKFSGSSRRNYQSEKDRPDGELYQRPIPNPFTPDWNKGYDDAIEGRPASITGVRVPANYRDGYSCGFVDREELNRVGSSNA
jgi:hypothetical protein